MGAGAATKGRYWEIIAVPDIREQAAAVAEDIERELGHESSSNMAIPKTATSSKSAPDARCRKTSPRRCGP